MNDTDRIDTRELVEELEELKGAIDGADPDTDGLPGATEDRERIAAIETLFAELRNYGGDDPEHGIYLISEDSFEDYVQELAEDIGAIDRDAGWPLGYIDWKAAAEALQIDYTSVTFDGVDYLYR